MNDTSSLLNQLKIDRPADTKVSRSRWPVVLAVLALLALAAAAFWMFRPAPLPSVGSAVARPVASGASAASVLDASGYVVARRQATVSSKITGKVVELLFEEGQAVAAGDVLARLDAANADASVALAQAQLEAARAELQEIRVQLAEAERSASRNTELARQQLVSQAALDEALASRDALKAQLASSQKNVEVSQQSVAVERQNLDDTIVRAPFAGVITVKNAQQGEMISPLSAGGDGTRTGIGTLVDMESLEVEVDVNENFINRVTPGQPVTAKLNAYPDWNIPAHVIAVVPTADRSKATVRVRIGLDERDARVLPEMGARVAFLAAPQEPSSEVQPGVVIPDEALADGVVFVIGEGSVLERRAVTVAGEVAGGVRISAGLREGERVATGDLTALADGVKVEVKP